MCLKRVISEQIFHRSGELEMASLKFGGSGFGEEGGLNQCLVGAYWGHKKGLFIRLPMICSSKTDKN